MMLRRLFGQIWKGAGKRSREAAPAQDAGNEAPFRDSPADWLRRGQALEQAGDLGAAIECYRACAAAHPADLPARAAIANALSFSWRMEECIAACADALSIAPRQLDVFSGYLLYSHYAANPDARALFELHRRYGELMRAATPPRTLAHARVPDPERPLRIGYLSRDFRTHSVAYFIEPVIAHHDRSRYRIYGYHTHEHSDETTQRLARSVDVWRDAHACNADRLADWISEDRIDILVDLGGHTKAHRLAVLARKPAPLQMTWLGYPDTTGLTTVDYRITDSIADPGPLADELHTERLLRLDPCFLCMLPPAEAPAVAARDGALQVVFGSFNMIMKVNEPLMALWAQVLQAVPGSRLLIKSTLLQHDDTVRRLFARFAATGIGPERIELRPWTDQRTQHLNAYGEVDIALDTFPYNGATTTLEALWMGVPVITLSGNVHMARVGASLLTAAGLSSLVTATPEEYVRAAVALAADPARRRAMRMTMRETVAASALMDHAGFTRKLESGLRQAWRRWCEAGGESASMERTGKG